MDSLTPAERSVVMSKIRGKDTQPELTVRRAAHKLGFRFRLYRKELHGKPDLTFPRLKKIIFIHGCFWHRHLGCVKTYNPKSNIEFWEKKFSKNVKRDAENIKKLTADGWEVLVIWECETKNQENLRNILNNFLTDN